MEIVKSEKGDLVPIKALPEKNRTEKVLEFGAWMSKLLSLKDEVSAERLEVLIPMISDYCWSMSIDEMKKALTKYVKSELAGLEPMTNFMDSVLFGKIIKVYKQQRPIVKVDQEVKLTQVEKEHNEYLNCILAFDEYVADQKVAYNYHVVYDALKSKGLITSISLEESIKLMEVAKSRLINESITNKELKSVLASIRNTDKERKWQIDYGKCILVERYFQMLIEKKIELKSVLK